MSSPVTNDMKFIQHNHEENDLMKLLSKFEENKTEREKLANENEQLKENIRVLESQMFSYRDDKISTMTFFNLFSYKLSR